MTGGAWALFCTSACTDILPLLALRYENFSRISQLLARVALTVCLMQRHQTRQMILNWQRHLKFPLTPRVSPEGISLLQSLLCEPENRLGSRGAVSVLRTNSILAQNRMSAYGLGTVSQSIDGADLIKVNGLHLSMIEATNDQIQAHPWFNGIDWTNIHRVKAPFRPELRNPADTRHFDDDIPAEVSITHTI